MLNHTPAFGEVCIQNQILIFISSDVSHVQWCYSAHNKASFWKLMIEVCEMTHQYFLHHVWRFAGAIARHSWPDLTFKNNSLDWRWSCCLGSYSAMATIVKIIKHCQGLCKSKRLAKKSYEILVGHHVYKAILAKM